MRMTQTKKQEILSKALKHPKKKVNAEILKKKKNKKKKTGIPAFP